MSGWRSNSADAYGRPCPATHVLPGPGPGWVTATGDLDWTVRPALHRALTDAIGGRPQCVYLDAHKVRLMDASTVQVLLECRRVAESVSVDLRVVGAAGVVRRVLELTGTWKMLGGEEVAPP